VFHHLSRLLRHSAVYGLAETISRGTGFLLMFIYLRLISDEEIGIRTLLYTASAFMGLFYTFGLDQAFLRYFMDDSMKDRRREIFTTSCILTIVCGIIFFLPAITHVVTLSSLITGNSGYGYATRLLFIIMLVDAISIYPMQVLRAENRFIYYLVISAERFILFIVLNLVFVGILHRSVNGIFEANLLVVVIILLSLAPVIKRYMGYSISFQLLGRMLAFGIPTLMTLFSMRIIDFSDRRLLEYFLSADEVGQYTAAYTLGMVGIMVFVNSFRIAWQPFFLSIQEKPEAKAVFSNVATYYMLFISIAFLGLTLFRELIFMYFAPQRPLALAGVIPVVALSYILYGFYIVLLPGAFIREKTGVLTVAAVAGAVVNFVLNIFFIPAFGIIGAAWTTLIAYTVMVFILFYMSNQVYPILYDFRRLAVIVIVTAVPVVLSLFIHFSNDFVQFCTGMFLFALVFFIYHCIGFWKEEERQYVRVLLRRIRSKAATLQR
jgi:O-antigen/teichoic acid export membrane protein